MLTVDLQYQKILKRNSSSCKQDIAIWLYKVNKAGKMEQKLFLRDQDMPKLIRRRNCNLI